MERADETLIRDADLRERLEAARGNFVFQTIARTLVTEQQNRDREAAKQAERESTLAALPRVRRKRKIIREVIETGEAVTAQNLRHIHSVLALCGLPHNKQPIEVREYERRQGRSSLVIEAGKLMTGEGMWEAQPLPYGSRARLLLLHLCSEAVRQKSPTIELADSLTAFIRDMGFEVTGGRNGSLAYFKQQVNALAACRMRIGVWGPKGAATFDTKPFSSMEVWLPTDPNQKMLWPTRITFSGDFFDSLSRHALPINTHVARAFSGSSRKLDILFWLSYRLRNIEQPLTLTWGALQGQFGEGFSRERDFVRHFTQEIADIQQVLPKVPLTLSERGMTLSPANSEALALPAPRKGRKR